MYCMENAALVQRLIEYPSDLPGCSKVLLGGRQLLYICSRREEDGTPFVVVLGFFSGQKEDIVTKDLIEPIGDGDKTTVEQVVRSSAGATYSASNFFFL